MRRAGTALLAATACLAALPGARAWAGTPGPIGELRAQHLVPAGVLR
ncbi:MULTISPECIES: hypothetical protein [Streptomyces violaceusniger group]|uniref:Uncharacterized protein n=2 Tax=Streptomyces rhizosphaericus TaxID=114699 RepID=A0ABN1RZT9_9ACTN|nr:MULTISPECIES: hypothetical protein [Streptomyces violaceusniger group]